MLVADGFGIAALADFFVEPASGIFAAGFAGERQAPLAETFFEERRVQRRKVADLADAASVQILLRHFADAGNLAHVERRQETRLLSGEDPQNPVGLGLIGGDLGHQSRLRRRR